MEFHTRALDTSGKNKEQKLQQSLPDAEYRFTVKLSGSYAGIHTPTCSCSLRRASGDTNCPSGRTNPDLFYGNKRDQIKMFPLSEQSTQICPRGPAAPAALSLVYVPVRLRRLPGGKPPPPPQNKARQLVSCTRRPQTHNTLGFRDKCGFSATSWYFPKGWKRTRNYSSAVVPVNLFLPCSNTLLFIALNF